MTPPRYPKLRPEVKTAWLQALRSGNLPQGRNALKSRDGQYCRLGVCLEQVLHIEAVATFTDCPDGCGLHEYGGFYFDGADGLPLDSQLQRMFEDSSYRDRSNVAGELAALNDSRKMSFEQIADWIEAML